MTEYRENFEHQKKAREEFWAYVHSTTLVPAQPHIMDTGDKALPGLKDAADECKHGRLPGDRTPPCGCYNEE